MDNIDLTLQILRVAAQVAVPVVIFIAGRQIARAQYVKSTQDAWNEFNKLVVANADNVRVGHTNFAFSWAEENEDAFRKAHIAFVALNAFMTVHYGAKHGLLPKEYREQNIEQVLRPFMDDNQIYDLVQSRGYPQEFKGLCAKVKEDLQGSSKNGANKSLKQTPHNIKLQGYHVYSHFEQLKADIETFESFASHSGYVGFFGQEVLRFYSIAGTMIQGWDFFLSESASNNERYITHILVRSLLENYFWIIYLFDEPNKSSARYEELKNSFKRDYLKLMKENQLPHKDQLEPADPSWSSLSRAPDVNSILAQTKNDYGDRLNYLYFLYRITSFDIHGKSLGTIFQNVFGKTCNFPVLKIDYAIDLVANQYLVILQELRKRDEG